MKKVLFLLVLLLLLTAIPLSVSAARPTTTTLNVTWNQGYIVYSEHNAYYAEGYVSRGTNNDFAATDVFTVAKAGTKITWTDADGSFADKNTATLSSWKQVDGEWVLDKDGPMFVGNAGAANAAIESLKADGVVTYTYVTSKDNENLRLCISRTADSGVALPTVTAETGAGTGTWASLNLPADPTVNPTSEFFPTVELDVKAVSGLNWNYGYICSRFHTSYANQAKKSANSTCLFSDELIVPKAGTTVYFFDNSSADQGGNTYLTSANYYIFSTWKNGTVHLDGVDVQNVPSNVVSKKELSNGMMYYYTTVYDNQAIRMTYYAGMVGDYTVSPFTYDVLLAESNNMTLVTATGALTSASYKNNNGDTVNYKIYIPANCDFDTAKTIFNMSSDETIINALIADNTDAVIFSFNGTAEDGARFIDAAVRNYGINKHRMFLLGNDELNALAAPRAFVKYMKDATGYENALAAGKALLDDSASYHPELEGITMYATGDSYFAGWGLGKVYSWVSRMGDKYDMDYVNYGISGCTVANNNGGANAVVGRYDSMADGDANVILIEGGRNDAATSSTSLRSPIGTNTSKDTTTFKGALNVIIEDCLKKYPNAIIILVTPWKHTTNYTYGSNVSYANAMKKIAEHWNSNRVYCMYAADPANVGGIDATNSTCQAKYFVSSTDVSHLNLEGMKLVQPYMEQFIVDCLEAYESSAKEISVAAELTSAQPTLGKDLTLRVFADIKDLVYNSVNIPADKVPEYVTARVTMNGNVHNIDLEYVSCTTYKFIFEGIAPQCMGDEIDIELIFNGETVAAENGYSIRKYCDAALAKSANELGLSNAKFAYLKTLIADLLEYGAAAQVYVNYKTDALVNDGITGATQFKEISENEIHKSLVTNNAVEGVAFVSAYLYFDNVNTLCFNFTAPASENVKVLINGVEAKVEATGAANTYVASGDAIYASQFDEVYTVELYYGGTLVQTFTYDTAAYIYAMQNKTVEGTSTLSNMALLARATRNYTLSADKYVNYKPAIEFKGEEDILP